MSKHALRTFQYDYPESGNPDAGISENGNARWAVSNVRQWLNSDAPSGEWYDENWAKKLGHEYDEQPTYGPYGADAAGFLAGFSKDLVYHFAKVKNQNTINNNQFEYTNDYVFLPSAYELNYSSTYDGAPLSYRFTDDESRIKTNFNDEAITYRTRSGSSSSYSVISILTTGGFSGIVAKSGNYVCPIIVLY